MADSLLGRDIITNQDIKIEQAHRTRGLYIIGATGSGKSVLTEQLAVQDSKDGLGFCVLDPHGDLLNNIMVRIPPGREKDVLLLDVMDTEYPFGLNLFECLNPNDSEMLTHTLDQVMQVFYKLWGPESEYPSWGPQLEDLLRNITLTLIENQGLTMCEIPLLLRSKDFRRKVVNNLTNNQVKLFWEYEYNQLNEKDQREMSFSTLNKVRSFTIQPLVHNIVGQSHTGIDFRSVIDTGKILLIQLPGRNQQITTLLGSMIISQILLAALSRADTGKRRQFNLYADEFQRFATPDMGTLLVEARKYGIATTVAHQVREQLDKENQSKVLQAGALVVFRVNSTDAEDLAAEFDTSPPQAVKPPGTVPADILNNLTDHPHEDVKHFWTIYVKKLLEAKTLQTQTPLADYYSINYEEKPYPYFFIDNKKVYFDPEFGRQLLEYLHQLFYNSSTHKGGNENLMKEAGVLFVQSLNQVPPLFNRNQLFNLFFDDLKYALYEVWQTPIETTTTEWQYNLTTQQTHADRKAQIANELTHLPIGTAKVRVPKWDKDTQKVVMVEHTIRTIQPYTPKADLAKASEIRQKYLEQTRKQYCRPRREVEEEIRKRQEPPPPPTTRSHQV